MTLPAELKAHLAGLLDSGAIRSVLGAIPGEGARAVASFARTPDALDALDLSPLATPNTLVHLTSEQARLADDLFPVAVLARGCETRMLNQIFAERGLARDQVHVVGLAHCPGAVDSTRLCDALPGLGGFPEVRLEGDEVAVEDGSGESVRLPRHDVVLERCRHCENHEPLTHDHLFALVDDEQWTAPEPDARDSGVESIDAMEPAERWSFWRRQLARCTRCNACRDACPLCYCENCILERLNPSWVGRSVDVPENTAYQLHRVMHLVGRCTACGECERACPVDIPLGLMMRKMEGLVGDLYGHKSGHDASGEHLLSIFDPRAADPSTPKPGGKTQ